MESGVGDGVSGGTTDTPFSFSFSPSIGFVVLSKEGAGKEGRGVPAIKGF
jgi:hypothetical protein